ncbi:hypothetical protein [Candidatus Leptofilum sp.]|uniref:hypothetical protein n=1 Tax=Candidatus Leptofilum sp. TaxID=3241576 RepID=UPI003B5B7B83
MKLLSKSLTWLVVIVLLINLLAVSPTTVYACTCAPPGSPAEELERATAVFAGKVTQIDAPQGLLKSSADPVQITFQVSEVWKGSVRATQLAKTVRSDASCGYSFAIGQEYLVYASGSETDPEVWLCSRTAPLAAAAEDLLALGSGEIPISDSSGSANFTSWLPSIFFMLLGLFLLTAGLFTPRLNRWLGFGERSRLFTVPRFQRSARRVEFVSRAVQVLLGLGFLLRGIGHNLYPHAILNLVSWLLLGLAVVGILVTIGLTLGSWRAGGE